MRFEEHFYFKFLCYVNIRKAANLGALPQLISFKVRQYKSWWANTQTDIMKPKIFLSHSKKDKAIIEKIANDLRYCNIDVWYDEWEIPPGESIRKKIFEDGIPNCDSFFVYLTPNSVDAYWVQKELDSAVIRDSEDRNSFLILFVDNDETRKKLPL